MNPNQALELNLVTGAAANGGSCVARHEGRVVFVRHALPGERVLARVTAQRGSYWNAEVIEVIDPSPDRIGSLCPIAGVDGAGCCDLAFAAPDAARAIKSSVVGEQLQRLGGFSWSGAAEPLSDAGPTGWRTRVRLEVGADHCVGFHRYHSNELVTDLSCGQLPDGMLDGLAQRSAKAGWPAGAQLHVALGDDGARHVVLTVRRGRRTDAKVVEGDPRVLQRVGERSWRIPATAFWQSHRDAAKVYSGLVADWAQPGAGMTAWDLYGGAGVFAAVLGDAVGESGRVLSVDTARAASAAARVALADLPQVEVVTDSVRRVLAAQDGGADIAVLDPPRSGAGREVIDLLADAGVRRVVHIGCEAASFARDLGLYRGHGYGVDAIKVFDAFPLTHHVECVALLTR
ncbi:MULTISPECIES: class I SAM-dependent RNA methyltransferase [Mycobacterium]|uniref:TRAM domain-containing protein n=1 Tax=Mycobacterium pseudoshottsii TaxID=265949 RepID=A0A9N7QNV0_9MYCO|nr:MULTISPECIES: TRAM domain-containing protein [Mycobacterium]EPQ48394.1 23S rRNA (Uracil-5-) -methyltransferase [Mycobacterium sp. 012931]EPQ75788.1 23S rRNA (Uracil-5-) -methyltransferase [Mycobacterium marinum MB2]MBC9861854.1 23S rRNA (uracil(1939)-C(5))-methyltransferase [Mycobacterium pseudoshottsii]MDC8970804.1 TRAM domain-containing protein [Mycobacterium marinum]RFZ61016.1 putative RNA methyltransferase/cg2084 [Mycobacterium marinum]